VGGACSANVYKLLVRKAERRRPLGTPKYTWGDNIKTDLVEITWGGVDGVDLAQNRYRWRALVNAVMNIRVLYNAVKPSNGFTNSGLSSSAQLHSVSWLVSYTSGRLLHPHPGD
jgi:hypothetical protein